MRRRRVRAIVSLHGLAFLTIALAFSEGDVTDRGPLVARVNGAAIHQTDLDRAIAHFKVNNRLPEELSEEQRLEVRKAVLDGLIGTELLSQEAQSSSIEIPRSEIDAAISRAREGLGEGGLAKEMSDRGMTAKDLELQVEKNLLVERLIRERILGTITISEEDLKRSYEENLEAMSRPEGVEANHIFVKLSPDYPEEKKTEARKKMATVVERLAAGEDFKTLARIYSEDASAAAGGSIGTVYKGQTIPEFETALFSTTEGAVSGVIESSLGLHLLQVTRKIPPGPMPFEEVKAQISESLRERRSFEAIQAMVDSLRSKAKVEIF